MLLQRVAMSAHQASSAQLELPIRQSRTALSAPTECVPVASLSKIATHALRVAPRTVKVNVSASFAEEALSLLRTSQPVSVRVPSAPGSHRLTLVCVRPATSSLSSLKRLRPRLRISTADLSSSHSAQPVSLSMLTTSACHKALARLKTTATVLAASMMPTLITASAITKRPILSTTVMLSASLRHSESTRPRMIRSNSSQLVSAECSIFQNLVRASCLLRVAALSSDVRSCHRNLSVAKWSHQKKHLKTSLTSGDRMSIQSTSHHTQVKP